MQGILCKAILSGFCNAFLESTPEQLFATHLNEFWADNGDELSRIYTGTGLYNFGLLLFTVHTIESNN